MTTTSSIEETLIDWFGAQSLEIKTISTENDKDSDKPHLYMAKGEFYPCCFDPEYDGGRFQLLYELEIVNMDERFIDTHLTFPTDTTFKIV